MRVALTTTLLLITLSLSVTVLNISEILFRLVVVWSSVELICDMMPCKFIRVLSTLESGAYSKDIIMFAWEIKQHKECV